MCARYIMTSVFIHWEITKEIDSIDHFVYDSFWCAQMRIKTARAKMTINLHTKRSPKSSFGIMEVWKYIVIEYILVKSKYICQI
jgi:hypothetical protein